MIKVSSVDIQKEIDDINIFKSNLSSWVAGVTLEQNIMLIIWLTIFVTALAFLVSGLLVHFNKKHK